MRIRCNTIAVRALSVCDFHIIYIYIYINKIAVPYT